MELILLRDYFPTGTNGTILYNGQVLCRSIELPWRNNLKGKSCIPEGKYSLTVGCNAKFGWHLMVGEVRERSGILVHPANNALTELKGCIAPVTRITGDGHGTGSRQATKLLFDLVCDALENEPVLLIILKNTL